jgi:hypothetical protein
MLLAFILGVFLLLPGVRTSAGVAVQATTTPQATPGQQPDATNPSPSDQQKAAVPIVTPPSPKASQPCTNNSSSGSNVKSDCKATASTRAKTRKRKTAAVAESSGKTSPPKTVVKNGGTTETTVDLSPGGSGGQQSSRQMESTNQLLATSDANLKKISGRQLSPNQLESVKQIKSYIEQAKTAAKGGDGDRAYNLAVKANLLSAELAGQ